MALFPPTPPAGPAMGWTPPLPPARSSHRARTTVALIAVVLVALGVGTLVPRPGSTGTAAVATASPSTASVAPPPATPAPAPTAVPTPDATPVAVQDTGTPWADFIAYMKPVSASLTGQLTTVSDDLTALDVGASRTDLATARATVRSVISWLSTHEPLPCYAAVHAQTLSSYRHYDAAFTAGLDALQTFADSDMKTFTSETASGTNEINDATAMMPAANTACGG